ncbi:MAG: DNA-3-methyladenine glycosylase I [Candidatus Altiarchaeota archaeon]|nr:DNA-3-methyladenine glycosylase I [Candidatus Altiarchaeota archaeon]
MEKYHDTEWGVPCYDDTKLFEFIILEGAQAGLSWSTILKRREGYRKAFSDFNPLKVSEYDENKVQELLQDTNIIRNKLKVRSAINNAKRFIEVQKEFGSFSKYMWGFVGGKPIVNHFKTLDELPAVTETAERFSKDLKKRGFNFVGPTIIYAHMQAVGMVNDHLVSCERHKLIQEGQ